MALKVWSALLQVFAVAVGVWLGVLTFHWLTR
jgi:hypothetical protein